MSGHSLGYSPYHSPGHYTPGSCRYLATLSQVAMPFYLTHQQVSHKLVLITINTSLAIASYLKLSHSCPKPGAGIPPLRSPVGPLPQPPPYHPPSGHSCHRISSFHHHKAGASQVYHPCHIRTKQNSPSPLSLTSSVYDCPDISSDYLPLTPPFFRAQGCGDSFLSHF